MSTYLGALLITFLIPAASLWAGLSGYYGTASVLRRQLTSCPTSRELRFATINVEVGRTSATIHRPAFTPARHPAPAPVALRAA